ncbi:MAG: hypothetical protein B7Y03_13090, partial [Polaromonas sp. 24-62-144]
MNKLFTFCMFAAGLALGQVALAQSAVTSTLAAQRVDMVDGKPVLKPAAQSKPGDIIEYSSTYKNSGASAADKLQATLPVPAGTTLIAGSAEPAQALASTDGVVFAAMPLMRSVRQPDGSQRSEAVPLADYRALFALIVVRRRATGGVTPCCSLVLKFVLIVLSSPLFKKTGEKPAMYAMPTHPQPSRLQSLFTHWIVGLFVALALALAGLAAHAAPPPAGTSISNQASASYSDASGVTRTVTSNVVQTTVQQVASLTLVQNGAQNATPGSLVYYPHTLTNTGNGGDTFNLLTSNTGAFSMTGVQIFADNGSGQPTGPAITSTGPLASNAAFKFIVVGTLPNTATA